MANEKRPEPVERGTASAVSVESGEQRCLDPQVVFDGATALGVLLGGAAAAKQVFGSGGGDSGSTQHAAPAESQP